MKIAESAAGWMVKLEPGEELHRDLVAGAAAHGVGAAAVSGIGAVDSAVIAWFDPAEKTYVETVLDEPLEVVSLLGNLTRVDGAPFLHTHVVVSRRDGQALGGHLVYARVSVTLELFLARFDLEATRRLDARWDLKLLDL